MSNSIILLLLLSLFALSVHADVFVSIDCGSSDNYTDGNSITWTGDDNFVKTGLDERVYSSYSVVMSTLRVFKSGKQNCYSINAVKGGSFYVRASFFYGNYDNKFAPPTFDLYFDGNFWATVATEIDKTVYYEVAYVAKSDTISVCLQQTQPGQFPFISALEVRSLDSNMYDLAGSNHALLSTITLAYGADSTIRYSEDAYDRIWEPSGAIVGYTVVTSDASSIDTSNGNKPPEAVMRNAVTPISDDKITLIMDNFPTEEVPIYAVFYFSEVAVLDSTQKRSFRLYKDGKAISSPISPPFGSVYQLPVSTNASSTTVFTFVATSDSTLPPLINAVEGFTVVGPLTGKSSTSSSGSDTSSGSNTKSSKLPVIVGSVAAVFIVFVAVGCLATCHHRRKTAAVAAGTTGFNGTAPQGDQPNNVILGKMGEVMISEIKVNMQHQTTSGTSSDNHDERNYT